MNRRLLAPAALLALAGIASPETRSLTLQQAVALALKQNPDYLLAQFDEQKARDAVQEARSPFLPQVGVGSGLAYSNGFPLSIEGSAPSIIQARGSQFLFNRPQSLRVREAREMAHAAEFATGVKAEEVAYRVAATYLDYERAHRGLEAARSQIEMLSRIERLVEERVKAGREIRLELAQARLETARARAQLEQLQSQADLLEATLRVETGLGDDVRIAPVETQLPAQTDLPASVESARAAALESSKEIRRLERIVEAKQHSVGAEKAGVYPRIDLVAQYALLGRFNNYEDFFRRFERHNGQIGMSFQLPLFAKQQIAPRVAHAEKEMAQAKLRLEAARANLSLEAQRLFRDVRQAESARDLARLELDVARESLSVTLARYDEGRVSLREVEQARLAESRKWEGFYDAQTAAERAKLNLLRQTGGLLAALR